MKTRNRTQLVVVSISLLLCMSLLASTSRTAPEDLPGYCPGWVDMNPTTEPSPRINSPLSYDSTADRVILFSGWFQPGGGITATNDTWAYDYNTNTWTNRSPSTQPPHRAGHGLAYDSGSDRTILFSGWDNGSHTTLVNWVDTWAYDYTANTWTNMSPVVTPPGKLSPGMTYDSESDRVILFGGLDDGAIYSDETWTYDYNTNNWTLMTPSTHPSGRFEAHMTYDSESDQAIMAGGFGASGTQDDTWAYDFNTDTWTNMNPVAGPSVIGALAYDSVSDDVVSFWGESTPGVETWTYDFNTNSWTQRIPHILPPVRERPYLAYDSESDVTILFGGKGENGFETAMGDTWAYYYIPCVDIITILLIIAVIIIIVVIVVVVWYMRRR
ncbi:MAG: Kelch repeat-containing protein [Candidatus Hermodarchaeia archaeon]